MAEALVVDCVTGEASVVETEEAPVWVPEAVTPRQARLALLSAGLLEAVEAAFQHLPPSARIEWDYALQVRRDSPLIAALAPELGLTDEQVDELFIEAARL